MAAGIGGSWGLDTGDDLQRKVSRQSLSQSLAAKLHTNMRASDVYQIPDDRWQGLSKGLVSREDLANILRVYESYKPPEPAIGINNPNALPPDKPGDF